MLSRVQGNWWRYKPEKKGGAARTFESRFGPIAVRRTRGWCRHCHAWRYPADAALGLADNRRYSPGVQEIAALGVSKLPVAEASAVIERLAGVKLPRATLDREARRQGQRAEAARNKCANSNWSCRWSRSLWCTEPDRWRWVYGATCFRLSQRAQTASGRPVILSRGYVIRRLKTHLAIRGSSDFPDQAAYQAFIEQVCAGANRLRAGKVAEEIARMRALPAQRYPETEQIGVSVTTAPRCG